MDPVILESARRHRIEDKDILHVYRNPVRVFEVDDMVMLIGPTRSAGLVELGVAKPKASSS